jgi:hypothetical protein
VLQDLKESPDLKAQQEQLVLLEQQDLKVRLAQQVLPDLQVDLHILLLTAVLQRTSLME